MTRLAGRKLRIFACASVLGMAAVGIVAATPASAAITPVPTVSHAAIPSTHRGDPFDIQNFAYGTCVGVTGDDAPVTLQPCDESSDQAWAKGPELGTITFDNNGTESTYGAYEVINQANGECLGILGNSMSNLAHAYSWGCNGANNQGWALDTGYSACDGFYPYANLNGFFLGVEANAEGATTIVQFSPFQGECNNQVWDLISS
jgi:hypothetical protein